MESIFQNLYRILWCSLEHKILYNTSKNEFLEENALYLAQQRLILAILTLTFWMSILWFIT